MAKKKKTQLKPVVRGFATTSVPKKAIHTEEGAEAEVKAGSANEEQSVVDIKKEGDISGPSPSQNDEFDPDKVEEQSLQNLVDRLQERTEKEITRYISTRFYRH